MQPLLLSAGCIPALILLAAVSIERWRQERRIQNLKHLFQ